MPDRTDLYRQLETVKCKLIVHPSENWKID
jgi:hypothetical protein